MQFDHIVFDNDPAQYITPSWQDLDQLSFESHVLLQKQPYRALRGK